MNKELRIFRGVINALTWMIVGMTLMSRFYCISMDITSGFNYIGWDTVAIILGGLTAVHLLMWFDPSFKEQ